MKIMLKAMTHDPRCHDRWRIKDDNCNEGRLITIFQSFFELLWAQFSREVLNFLMVKTDSKFWKISWKSDKTKATRMKESNWADRCGGVYLWSPPSLWFSSPSGRKKEVRVSLERLELRLHSRTHRQRVFVVTLHWFIMEMKGML